MTRQQGFVSSDQSRSGSPVGRCRNERVGINRSADDGPDAHLRETLREGFGNRMTLRFADAAKLLNLDQKTLRRLTEQGKVPCRITGTGRRRLRREFTLSDLESFFAAAAARPARCCAARTIARGRVRVRVRGSFLAAFPKEEEARR
jgi:hypothetical protein